MMQVQAQIVDARTQSVLLIALSLMTVSHQISVLLDGCYIRARRLAEWLGYAFDLDCIISKALKITLIFPL